jgi:hypothetical protein
MDAIPKITDISSLKGISSLLALPLLCVAYILQTGANISLDGNIWFGVAPDMPENIQLNRLILIFVAKSLWVSFFAVIAYGVVAYAHYEVNFPFLQVTSVVLIAFALFGLFGAEAFPQIKVVNSFWFYSFIVWGIFLQTMREQLDGKGS